MALVTGAGRRLGRSTAEALARGGWDLALHHHQSEAEALALCEALERLGTRARAFPADLSDEAQTVALVPAVVGVFGRLDAVVNNASRFTYDTVEDFTYGSLEAHARVNTAAPVALARGLARHLSERGAEGCVVQLLDQKLWNPNPDYFSYTLSKAALGATVVLLAQALAPRVRCVGVAPGVTLPSGPMDAEGFERARRLTPLGRSSTPEDVARAVLFALESTAITGTTLVVDGGQHLTGQGRDVLFLQGT
ncbi:MAG: SDR family oxidoreductase [Deltaproteobacteria bacterium]|nr:SDR family oxidoreductase [Deltaproteobacteria bacterium]